MAAWSIRFPDSEDTEESQTQKQEEQNELSLKISELIRRAAAKHQPTLDSVALFPSSPTTSPILFSSPHVSPQSQTAAASNSWPSSAAVHINVNNSHTFEDTEESQTQKQEEQNELSLKIFELIRRAAAAHQPTQNSVALFPSPPTTSPILFSSPHVSPQSQQTAAASNSWPSSAAAQAHINVNNSHTFESPLQALQAQKGTTNYNIDVGNFFTSNSNKELIYDEPEQEVQGEDLDGEEEDSLEDFVECNETTSSKKRHHTGPIRNQYIEEKRARQSSKSKRKITLKKKVIRYTFIY